MQEDASLVPEGFQFSMHWVKNFRAQHGIRHVRIHGEAADVMNDMMEDAQAKIGQWMCNFTTK